MENIIGEAERKLVLVDSAEVHLPQDVQTVDIEQSTSILAAMRLRYYPFERFVVGRIEEETGKAVIHRDGRDLCQAFRRAKDLGVLPSAFKLAMVCSEEYRSSSSPVLRVFRSEPSSTQKNRHFPDLMVFLARLRDANHGHRFESDSKNLNLRPWAELHDAVSRHYTGLGDVSWFLQHDELPLIFHILCSLRPWFMDSRGKAQSGDAADGEDPDSRPWDAFVCVAGKARSDSRKARGVSAPIAAGETPLVTCEMLSIPFILGKAVSARGKYFHREPFFMSTHPGTSFEKVLFLSVLFSFQSTRLPTSRSMDLSKRPTNSTVASAPNGYVPGFKHSQRIAFAVKAVHEAWDLPARLLGFNSLEHMVAPYILFDEHSCSFVVLDGMLDGVAPQRQSKYLLHRMGAQQHENSMKKEGGVSSVAEAQIRGGTTRFFDNMWECVLDKLLYSEDPHVPGAVLHTFMATQITSASEFSAQALGIPERVLHFVSTQMVALGGNALVKRSQAGATWTLDDPEKPISDSEEELDSMSVESSSMPEDSEMDDVQAPVEPPNPKFASMIIDEAMKDVIQTFNCSFKDFPYAARQDTPDMLSSLFGTVQLVLTDPPYGTRQSRGRINSEHDTALSEADVYDAARLIWQLLRPGGHCILFSAMSQFEIWRTAFESFGDMNVDSMPLFLVKAPKAYSQSPRRKSTGLTNMVEIAVHCCKKGAGNAALRMVTYKNFDYIPSRFAPWTNVIDNVGNLAAGEAHRADDAVSGRSVTMRHEQKSLPLCVELVSRFSLPKDIVVDLFSGTYTTAVACLRVENGLYRQFFGCELDPDCHLSAQDRIRMEFSAEVLKGTFGSGQTELWEAAKQIQSVKKVCRVPLNLPEGLPGFCLMPSHILTFMASSWRDIEAVKILKEKPVHEWPPLYMEKAQGMDPDVLLTVDCTHHRVMVSQSTIPDAGDGLFTMEDRRSREIIGWYNGSVVYGNLHSPSGCHGTGILGASTDRLRTYGIQVDSKDLTFKKKDGCSLYLVPPEFCAFAKMNDPKYKSRKDRASRPDPILKRTCNVAFEVETPASTSAMLTDPYFIKIVALRNIRAGEELFIDYGPNYVWPEL